MYNFDPYNVLLAIATNIPVLLMTAFVLQGHIWHQNMNSCIVIRIGFSDLCSVISFSLSQLSVLCWMRMWGLLNSVQTLILTRVLSLQTVALLWSSALQLISVSECISDDQRVWDSVNVTELWPSRDCVWEHCFIGLRVCVLSEWTAVLLSGGLAGMAGWSVGTPMDVIKARLQMDGVRGERRYRGLLHCVTETVQNEGLGIFFRSLGINCLRAFPVNMVVFAVYEVSVRLLRSASVDRLWPSHH